MIDSDIIIPPLFQMVSSQDWNIFPASSKLELVEGLQSFDSQDIETHNIPQCLATRHYQPLYEIKDS